MSIGGVLASREPAASAPDRAGWRERLSTGALGSWIGDVAVNASAVLLMRHPLAGLVLVAVGVSEPRIGACGLSGMLLARAVIAVLGAGRMADDDDGSCTVNGLLVGLSVGWLFPLSPVLPLLLLVAVSLCVLLTLSLAATFRQYLALPVLSLPFALVSGLLFLLAGVPTAGAEIVVPAAPSWPGWLEPVAGFGAAFAHLLFLSAPTAGLILGLVVLLVSRVLFLLAVAGYLLGAVSTGLLAGGSGPDWLAVTGFNPMLTAMALGGVFLVPSPRSLLIAALGVGVSVLISLALTPLSLLTGVPPLTLPFVVATLSVLHALRVSGGAGLAGGVRETPEATLAEHRSRTLRFGVDQPLLALPFSGTWTVWQGFDGPWTHQGNGRYAYDFVIERDGRTHAGDGTRIEDYFAFRRPVLSPVAGTVVAVVADRPDNPPGALGTDDPWGNRVIIDTGLGWWVELSHFARGSLRVVPGERVAVGALLGLCGSSGYSPQPHIHVQVQAGPATGAPTLRFAFAGYQHDGELRWRGTPAVGARIEPLVPDGGIERRLTYLLDQRLTYRVRHGEGEWRPLTLIVRMVGTETCLESDRGRLFFSRDRIGFQLYRIDGDDPWLAMLLRAVPRVPTGGEAGLTWRDRPPTRPVRGILRRYAGELRALVDPDAALCRYRAGWTAGGRIEGTLVEADGRALPVRAELDPRLGFSRVRLGDEELELDEAEIPCNPLLRKS